MFKRCFYVYPAFLVVPVGELARGPNLVFDISQNESPAWILFYNLKYNIYFITNSVNKHPRKLENAYK